MQLRFLWLASLTRIYRLQQREGHRQEANVLSVSVIWCYIEALKRIALQKDQEVPKKSKNL